MIERESKESHTIHSHWLDYKERLLSLNILPIMITYELADIIFLSRS